MVGNIPGFLSPIIAAEILGVYGHTKFAWGLIYGIGGVLIILGGIFFLIFGSGQTVQY